jgi:hypothetical protein
MEYSGAGGKLTHEKNQKQKISWHCPFKLNHPDVRSCVAADVDLDGKVSVEEFDSMIEAAAALPR